MDPVVEFDFETLDPLTCTELPWIWKENLAIRERLQTFPIEETGKWMLYFDNENICDAWSRAKDLYDRGDLEGIVSMKVSTEFGNQFGTVKASDRNSKVIIFYCGPFNAERDMKRYGENVLNKMGYGRQKCHGYFPSRIYYKSDAQTLAGATSGKKHLYSLNF